MSRQSGRTNSKTGCQTCKIRRVKCDEEKPSCRRCLTTGRRCDYAALSHCRTPPWGSIVSIQSSPFTPSSGHAERRSFEYYFYRAAPSISGVLDVDFWKGVVLQICRSEPAIWDAVVAASIFYEAPPSELLEYGPFWKDSSQGRRLVTSCQSYRQALVCYSRSLEAVHTQIQLGTIDVHVALISCTLFMCIETLQGNKAGEMELYKQGIQMLGNVIKFLPRAGEMPNAGVLDQIMAIFIRLGSVAFITAGVPFELSIPPLELPKPCYCLPSARSFLIRLVSECLSYESAVSQYIKDFGPGKVQPLFTAQMYTLQSKLCEWKHNFDQLSINESTRLSDLGIKSTLLMIYHSLFILVSSSLRKQETEYDQFLDSFQSIVDHGESAVSATTDLCGSNPHFTFEIGVGMPLLVTALKCRDSSIRYKALSLLRRCPSTQGFYMVSHGSALAAKAIEIEESLGCNPANPDRIDEETSRLQYMTVYPQDPDFSLLVARKQPASETSGLNELTLVETRVFLSQEIAALR